MVKVLRIFSRFPEKKKRSTISVELISEILHQN